MSWLDDVPVGNDDQNPYDPNQPVEREFVLAPAWRAFTAQLSAIFKRSGTKRKEEYSPVSEPAPLTARISEPEPHPMQQVDEPELSASASNYQPASEAVPSAEPEPVIATPFEPEPVVEQFEPEPVVEQVEEQPTWPEAAPIALNETATFHESIPEAEAEPLRYEEPSRLHLQPEIQTEIEEKAIAAAASASQSVETQSTQSAAHATSATVLANARGESKLVAAAVAIESWAASVKNRFVSWRASRKEKLSRAQQERFLVPGSTSKRSERDRLWMQTTVAAAAIALAFLMGWIAANSRRPASSTADEAVTAPTEPPASKTRGVSSSAMAKPAGVTVKAGGATVQAAGGVTLLPSSTVSAVMPATTAAETVPSKPSPARAARHSRTTSRAHLRRSIDAAPNDDEVVVHHYAPKSSPMVATQKQTAQVKQYSDIN